MCFNTARATQRNPSGGGGEEEEKRRKRSQRRRRKRNKVEVFLVTKEIYKTG